MSDLDSAVQMTHSAEDTVYDPTTKAEWERRIQSLKDDSGDIILDLEDQVKRLDAELHDSAKNVLSLSSSLGKKIERVSELERLAESWLCMDGLTVRDFFADARCPDCGMSKDWLAEALEQPNE